MDERERLHQAGCIVYEEVLSPEQKRAAMEVFLSIDSNRDGSISLQELLGLQSDDGTQQLFTRQMFPLLDIDNSGSLDFNECKALFFLVLCISSWGNSAWRCCDACGAAVFDSIYTCTACLVQDEVCYDLCRNCYPSALRSHVPSIHRSQFERQDLMVADIIDKVLTWASETSIVPNNIIAITHNNYHFHSNSMPCHGNTYQETTNNMAITPYNNGQNNATSLNVDRLRTTARRLVQVVSFTASVATVVTSCSIM